MTTNKQTGPTVQGWEPLEWPVYLTRSQAAHYLGISVRLIDSEAARGNLKAYRIGRRVLYRRVDVERLPRPVS